MCYSIVKKYFYSFLLLRNEFTHIQIPTIKEVIDSIPKDGFTWKYPNKTLWNYGISFHIFFSNIR